MKLNLGCGINKLEDYVNVDVDANLNPDQTFDFAEKWPYEDDSIDEVVCYHTIEHIQKWRHQNIFFEAYRCLKRGGLFTISFPEFLTCVEYWKENKRGQRDFWEATIYGRQASPHDYHISLMNRDLVSHQLVEHGFEILYCGPEPVEDFNSVIKARKDQRYSYEDALRDVLCPPDLK